MLFSASSFRSSTTRDAIGIFSANYMGGDAWYNVTVKNDTQYFSDFDYYASKVARLVLILEQKIMMSIENLRRKFFRFLCICKKFILTR